MRSGRRQFFLEQLARLSDIMMSPLAVVGLPAVALAGRLGWRAPICRAIYEMVQATVVRHHYYNPVVYPSDLMRDLNETRPLPGLDLREQAQIELLSQLVYADEIPTVMPQFDFDNPNYAHDDVVILYNILRHYKPRRVIEIGSGFSTLVTRAALSKNGSPAKHVCIEPFEMAWLESTGVHVIRERVERVGTELFRELQSGDVLFIDSSHVIRPQGDVLHEFLEILPILAPGVIVHIHDVYTPYDYHPYIVVQQRKMWNEQYVLEALLTGGDRYEVILATYWICRRQDKKFAQAVPGFSLPPKRDACSFWIRRRAA